MQRGACGVGACLAQPFTVRQLAIAVLLAVTRVRIVSLREAGQRPTEIRLGRRP